MKYNVGLILQRKIKIRISPKNAPNEEYIHFIIFLSVSPSCNINIAGCTGPPGTWVATTEITEVS